MSCDAFSTSSSAHAPPQASVEPAPPTLYVPSKGNKVPFSLIKPTSTHAEATQTLLRWPKLAAWVESVAEKVEPARGATDKALHPVQAKMERSEDRV